MIEKIKTIYFSIWADGLYFFRNKNFVDDFAFFYINILIGLHLFIFRILLDVFLGINFEFFDVNIYLAVFIFSLYVIIPLIINYYIVYKKRDIILKKYPHKNGKIFMYYGRIFFGILFILLIIGFIVAS